jgi:uncharacterized OB-fold protein
MIYPAPRTGREAMPHWKAARGGTLLLPFNAAGSPVWPPGAAPLTWRTVRGVGTIASYSIVRRPVAPEWKDKGPYCVAAVDLESGHRLLTNIINCDVEQVRIGAVVQCKFVETDDPELGLVVFRLA